MHWKMPWLHLSKDKLIILFPKLEKIADNMDLTTLRISTDLPNTPAISIEIYKNKINGLLKILTIVDLPKIEKITSDTRKI